MQTPSRRFASLCLAGAVLLPSRPAAAEEHLAWAGSLSEVDVEVVAEIPGCPSADSIAERTNAYVGWTFAHSVRSSERVNVVRLVFTATDSGQTADVRLFSPADSAPDGVSLRVHEVENDCEELGRMAALTVSLLARTNPETPAPVAAAVAPTAAPPPTPPSEAPAAEPPPTPPSEAPAAEPPPPPESKPPPDTHPGLELGASVLGGYGYVPGWSAGGALFGALHLGRFSTRLAGSVQAGPGETVPETGAGYRGFGGTVDGNGCYRFLPRTEVCALFGVLWLVASGSDFDEDRQGVGAWPLVGLGLAQHFPAGSKLEWGLRLEGTAPLGPIELFVEDSAGNPTAIWQAPPVGVRLGLELSVH